MKAICITEAPEGPTLALREIDTPVPGPGEVLLRVHAAGVNFADLYRATKHFGADGAADRAIAGLEVAGEVIALGTNVHGLAAGDRVMALASGTYAEFCCVNAAHAIVIPGGIGWTDAAAIPAAFLTAHDALVTNGELRAGETVLIQAASSSVGLAALQLARHLGAAQVIGTSTSDAKLARLAELGLAHGINGRNEDFVARVVELTDGRGIDVTIDNIGGDTLAGDLECAAVRGRIINVGRLGKWTGHLNLDEHSRKRVKVIGVSFRTRSVEEHRDVASKAAVDILPALRMGAIRPVVDRVFPLDAALAAQDYLRSGQHFGKVVLAVTGDGAVA